MNVKAFLLSFAFLLFCSSKGLSKPADWVTPSPESQKLKRSKLDAFRKALAYRKTKALLVVKNEQIVYEWYAPGCSAGQRQGTASLAKALVGGMSLLLALSDGRIHLDDPAYEYIPYWKGDSRRSTITIRHLATHCSGIEDAEAQGLRHEELSGWKGSFWRRDPNPFQIALTQAPVIFPPGTSYAYSNPGMAALAYAVSASLKGGTEPDIFSLLKKRIMDPLGVPPDQWSIGYGKAYPLDNLNLYASWGGAAFTPRAAARVGCLMLRQGRWGERSLVDPVWAEAAVTPAATPRPGHSRKDPKPATGLCWWTNLDGVWPTVPRDAFAGAGAGHQFLLVIPSLHLVVVRNGEELSDPATRDTFWGAAERYFLKPLMEAVRAR